mmetsp:Transcript_76365/g.151032  ORF Transcript_76365/g.151032 Transcript_76365/m.151032 type:complete len:230 (-) Transcript_76365:45-734(-)
MRLLRWCQQLLLPMLFWGLFPCTLGVRPQTARVQAELEQEGKLLYAVFQFFSGIVTAPTNESAPQLPVGVGPAAALSVESSKKPKALPLGGSGCTWRSSHALDSWFASVLNGFHCRLGNHACGWFGHCEACDNGTPQQVDCRMVVRHQVMLVLLMVATSFVLLVCFCPLAASSKYSGDARKLGISRKELEARIASATKLNKEQCSAILDRFCGKEAMNVAQEEQQHGRS